MPELTPAAQLKQSKDSDKPLVILVMTDQNTIQSHPEESEPFYVSIETLLRAKGFRVRRDPGEQGTQPEDADVWIGHGSGCDCIQGSGAKAKLFIKTNSFDLSDKIEAALEKLEDKFKNKSQIKKLLHELIKDIISKKEI